MPRGNAVLPLGSTLAPHPVVGFPQPYPGFLASHAMECQSWANWPWPFGGLGGLIAFHGLLAFHGLHGLHFGTLYDPRTEGSATSQVTWQEPGFHDQITKTLKTASNSS